jgi:hypothetical protein
MSAEELQDKLNKKLLMPPGMTPARGGGGMASGGSGSEFEMTTPRAAPALHDDSHFGVTPAKEDPFPDAGNGPSMTQTAFFESEFAPQKIAEAVPIKKPEIVTVAVASTAPPESFASPLPATSEFKDDGGGAFGVFGDEGAGAPEAKGLPEPMMGGAPPGMAAKSEEKKKKKKKKKKKPMETPNMLPPGFDPGPLAGGPLGMGGIKGPPVVGGGPPGMGSPPGMGPPPGMAAGGEAKGEAGGAGGAEGLGEAKAVDIMNGE